MRLLAIIALLIPTLAHAQTAIPSTGSAAAVIPALQNARTIRYQVQGTGYACVSWSTTTPTITGTDGTAKCTGAGAFLVTGLFVDSRVYPASVPGQALFAIGAAGSSLQISYEAN